MSHTSEWMWPPKVDFGLEDASVRSLHFQTEIRCCNSWFVRRSKGGSACHLRSLYPPRRGNFFSLQDQQRKAVLFLRRDGGLGDELSWGFRHILASITDTSRDGRLAPTYGRFPSKQGHEAELAAHTQTLTFTFYVLSGKCPPGRNNTNTSSRTVRADPLSKCTSVIFAAILIVTCQTGSKTFWARLPPKNLNLMILLEYNIDIDIQCKENKK